VYSFRIFTDFLPALVASGHLPAGAPVYIPNHRSLLEVLAGAGAFTDYGDVVAVPACRNPLFAATAAAERMGRLHKTFTNGPQIGGKLVRDAEFVVVHYCGDAANASPSTLARRQRGAGPAAAGAAGAAAGAAGGGPRPRSPPVAGAGQSPGGAAAGGAAAGGLASRRSTPAPAAAAAARRSPALKLSSPPAIAADGA
jgi:hypothetical protein